MKFTPRLCVLFSALLALPLWSTTITTQESPGLTLRATTHMVLLDLEALDSHGHPLRDLKPEELTVLESGKKQVIAVFTAQTSIASARPHPLALPANVYTNRPEFAMPAGPLTVILLDALNTRAQDQTYARRKLLQYLSSQLQPGERVAVFALGHSLSCLQDFTDDATLLRTAIAGFNPQVSPELLAADVEKQLPHPHESGGTSPRMRERLMAMLGSLRSFYSEQSQTELDFRIVNSLAAFRAIARAVAGHPGRKNLIWVSGGFPLTVKQGTVQYKADLSDPNRIESLGEMSSTYSFQNQFRQTVSLLGEAQVSIYPVDARGLVGPLVADSSDPGTDQMSGLLMGAEYANAVAEGNTRLLADQQTMEELAEQTGGFVFKNRNDIDQAIPLILADSAFYYELGYYPENRNWNGSFRRIEVRTRRANVKLRYRRGYYALDMLRAGSSNKPGNSDLAAYLAADLPPATMVVFDTRMLPTSPANAGQVAVDFLVDMHSLSAEPDAQGTRQYQLEFHVAAFTPQSKLAGRKDVQLIASVKANLYDNLLQNGLPFHASLSLPAGQYRLRLAVRDERTGFLGTTDLPLKVNREVAAAPPHK
jgi:VWFA-related protein